MQYPKDYDDIINYVINLFRKFDTIYPHVMLKRQHKNSCEYNIVMFNGRAKYICAQQKIQMLEHFLTRSNYYSYYNYYLLIWCSYETLLTELTIQTADLIEWSHAYIPYLKFHDRLFICIRLNISSLRFFFVVGIFAFLLQNWSRHGLFIWFRWKPFDCTVPPRHYV